MEDVFLSYLYKKVRSFGALVGKAYKNIRVTEETFAEFVKARAYLDIQSSGKKVHSHDDVLRLMISLLKKDFVVLQSREMAKNNAV